MPTPFPYLDDVALKYGHDEVQVQSCQQRLLDALTSSDLDALGTAYLEVQRRGDALALLRYAPQPSDEPARRLLLLLFFFDGLAKRGITPFSSDIFSQADEEGVFDWSKLPAGLEYLAGPAERYGKYQFEEDVESFLCDISAADLEELATLNRRLGPDWAKVEKFIRDHPLAEHDESRYVYFLLHMIALLNDRNELA